MQQILCAVRAHAKIQFKVTLTSDKNAQNTKCLAWLLLAGVCVSGDGGDLAPPTPTIHIKYITQNYIPLLFVSILLLFAIPIS